MTAIDLAVKEYSDRVRGPPTELQTADIEDLTRLLTSVFGGEPGTWRECFAHWWERNPARQPAIPRGWIVRAADGTLLAFTANIPFRYVIDGRPALCCATGSLAVAQHWRGLGLAKAVGQKFIHQPNADLLTGTDSTPAAFALWRTLGMQSLHRPWLNTNSRMIADGVEVASAMAQTMGLPSIIGRGAGCGLALYLNASAAVMQRSKSLSVTKVENFAGVDDSALEICSASNASTRSWRDTETLNWLCFGSQYLRRTRIVLAARSGSKLIGYLAMKRWRGHSYYLLECRCREADPEIARQLIWAARGFAQQDGAQCIFIRPYSRMIEEAIPRTISITLSRPEMTYCYAFKAANVAPDNWEATPGDGDVSVN